MMDVKPKGMIEILKDISKVVFFLLLFFIFYYIQNTRKENELTKRGTRYSIAKIVDKNSRNASYNLEMNYQNRKVEFTSTGIGIWLTFKKRVRVGDKVYVAFPKGKPEDADFFLDFDVIKPVPNPPPNGWLLQEIQAIDTLFKPGEVKEWFWPKSF